MPANDCKQLNNLTQAESQSSKTDISYRRQ